MLVFGDVEETRDAASLRSEIEEGLSGIVSRPAGIARHSALAQIFLTTADLCRGLVDRDMAGTGTDDHAGTALLMPAVLLPLARLLERSWRTDELSGADIAATRAALATWAPGGAIRCKPMEGHAFYALYPEAYAEAARRSRLPPSTMVIGIRSIGMGLAAMVAAALGRENFVTVRPVGHPFDRRLAVSEALCAAIFVAGPSHFAIVDEGPGLSGSSFFAVADWLEAQGVERHRIHFFPGHDSDPGAHAGAERLARWRTAPRHQVETDELVGERLGGWVAGLVGPLDGPLCDISWGAWRAHVRGAADAPLRPQWERRKFLVRAGERRWLVKFAGLGAVGRRKLELAGQLHAAGFGPRPAGLCYGFLVQEWREAPNLAGGAIGRDALVAQLGAYLSLRAKSAADADGGATLEQLARMAQINTRETLGEGAANALGARMQPTQGLARAVRRVETDGALHRWEWLVDGGRLIKTDAVDHARGHDVIGRQDITWDVAGAIVEHQLSGPEITRLIAVMADSGTVVSPPLLDFMLPAYLAFQLGSWTMSGGATSPEALRYGGLLRAAIVGDPEAEGPVQPHPYRDVGTVAVWRD